MPTMLSGSRPRIGPRVASLLAVGGLSLGLSLACGPRFGPEEPVDSVNDACCKVANADMTKFAGCRPTGRCAKDEPIWMRGYIRCTPVEEERCAGGRCCEYRPMLGSPDAVLHWDDSSGDAEAPADDAAPAEEAAPAAEEAAPATEAAPGPEAAPGTEAAPATEAEPATEPTLAAGPQGE